MQCSNCVHQCIAFLTAGIARPTYVGNTMTCVDMIAALENSSILFTSAGKVLIQTRFNSILRKNLLQGHLKCLSNIVMYVTSFSRSANSYSTSQIHKYYKP